MYGSSRVDCASESGSLDTLTLRLARVARARWIALLMAGTDVSRHSAISDADQPSTSVSSSAARWRAGRCCSAATNARRVL